MSRGKIGRWLKKALIVGDQLSYKIKGKLLGKKENVEKKEGFGWPLEVACTVQI